MNAAVVVTTVMQMDCVLMCTDHLLVNARKVSQEMAHIAKMSTSVSLKILVTHKQPVITLTVHTCAHVTKDSLGMGTYAGVRPP